MIVGEGELALVDVLTRVKAGQPLTDCPGLLLRVNGEVFDTGRRELISDLNQVPAPEFSDYTFEMYRAQPVCP